MRQSLICFLFTLIIDAFNNFLETCKRKNIAEGFETEKEKIRISPIKYVDDTLHIVAFSVGG